jgi:hypothetical protein
MSLVPLALPLASLSATYGWSHQCWSGGRALWWLPTTVLGLALTNSQRGGRGPVELSQREWAVLHDLARVRLLTVRHVQRLHVHEGSPLTQARRTRSTLQRLNDLGLVHRLERRVGGVYAGSSGFVYGLAAQGQRLISGMGPAGGRRLRKPWEPSSAFTDHVLAVSDLYVHLRELERTTATVELLDFTAEPACWRWWWGVSGERLVCKPDAVVVLGLGELERHLFVELDRSTESLSVIRRKAETYVAHYLSGTEQQHRGLYPRVCFVVPDAKRAEQITEVLRRLDADYWQLFQVITSEETEALVR